MTVPPAPTGPPAGPPTGPPAAVRAPLPSYPHAEPQPYHRILRTWTYRPWRVLVGLLLSVLLGLVVAPLTMLALVGVVLEVFDLGSFMALFRGLGLGASFTPSTLLVINLALAMLIPISWLTVRYLHNLRPRWLGSVRPGLRWGLLGRCVGLALVATLLALGASVVLLPASEQPVAPSPSTLSLGTTVAYLLVIVLTSPLQSAGEEYFFRGYLLQAFGAVVRAPWFALVATSLLFALAHGGQNLPLFVDRFLFGLAAGVLVLLTGGLEAGIAMHLVNNVLVLGLSAATGTLPQALGVSEASWSLVAFDVGQFVLFGALVLWMCRRDPRVQTRTAGPPPATSPA